MSMTTVRLRPKTHKVLKELAEMTGESIQDALERAVEDRQRRLYLEGLNADYAALRRDPKAWAEFQKENALWDVTNEDGLDTV